MAITSTDQLIAALCNSQHVLFDKSSVSFATAGRFFSLWRAPGRPGPAVIPTVPEICAKDTLGALIYVNAPPLQTNYLAWLDIATGNANTTLEIHDRLCQMGGLVADVVTSQAVNLTLVGLPAERIGPDDYSQLQWWLEFYADTGGGAATATVNVTYNDDTSGNISLAIPTFSRASTIYQLLPFAAGKKGIKSVNSVTLSGTTGNTANFGVTCTRYRAGLYTRAANKAELFDWALLSLPALADDACLVLVQLCTATTTGPCRGVLRFVSG